MTPRIEYIQSEHTSSRNGASVVAIVIHATAGTNSRSHLTRNRNGVSAHALIEKDGTIVRFVADELAAHHVGYSQIVHRGKVYNRRTTITPNQLTLGVELENRNDGKDPYTTEQLDALGWLLVQWLRKYPRARMVFHYEIDTQGKTDPIALTWPIIMMHVAKHLSPAAADPVAQVRSYTADSLIISTPGMSADKLVAAAVRRCRASSSPYSDDELRLLFLYYVQVCGDARVDPVVAIAQCLHETGNMTSARSRPPQYNLAGIGATDDDVPGADFPSLEHAVRAQVGRLLAYALPAMQLHDDASYPTEVRALLTRRRELIDYALDVRGLDDDCRGSAQTLRLLGWQHNPKRASWCGWAYRGEQYGANIAAVCNALRA